MPTEPFLGFSLCETHYESETFTTVSYVQYGVTTAQYGVVLDTSLTAEAASLMHATHDLVAL